MTREEIVRLLRDHQADLRRLGVRSLAIFGSAARNEAGPGSDVDLLVEFDRPVGLFRFLDLKEFLEGLLGCRVDLGTPDSLHPRIRARVLQEAIHVV